ncbi:hypothetical protein [Actinoplanes regularis]|uniref:hypothetical protein n=1 Tax=Actinoplanes regularis TaxID=52697 RepID=UPI0025550317|nr:hypothetical protein [Actinoplanes regularis]GLW27700.1 hypothetical protein Areg01_06400 [Actinoplanes regularis]
MSRRASGIVLFVLSVPLFLLGISAWMDAHHEAGVRAGQLSQARTATGAQERERFADYAESTLWRLQDAQFNRNTLLAAAAAGLIGGIVVLVADRRRRETEPADDESTAPPPPAKPALIACQACQWKISTAATACPHCGHPHEPAPSAPEPPAAAPIHKGQRAFYVILIALGLGSALVIYTVLFDSLSETELVRISPYWVFPTVFGYYGLVAQRMEARLQESHLDTVSEQLLNVIKESGSLGQVFALLIHAPFLLVKSRQPWVTALVGSLIWAIALTLFFSLVFPTL